MHWARWETKQPKASVSSSSGTASVNRRMLGGPIDIGRHSSFADFFKIKQIKIYDQAGGRTLDIRVISTTL